MDIKNQKFKLAEHDISIKKMILLIIFFQN